MIAVLIIAVISVAKSLIKVAFEIVCLPFKLLVK